MYFTRVLLGLGLLAASLSAKTLLVLPIAGEEGKNPDLATVNRLFLESVQSRYNGATVGSKTPCEDRDCAVAAAKAAQADEVLYSSLYRLGSKWIFSATLVHADGSGAFNQRLTSASIEDMEAVSQRMADALMSRKTTEQVASVDNITEKELTEGPRRRRSLYNGGVAIGYLFPSGSSFSYRDEDYFSGDVSRQRYSQVIRLAWLNTWEFKNNLALDGDVTWSVPVSIGADLNVRYLFGRGDVAPFVGGGVGLHYVSADENADPDKRNSGPALNAQAGLVLFRTYDVNVRLRGQYIVIFNTDIDHGAALDIGVSFRQRESGGSRWNIF